MLSDPHTPSSPSLASVAQLTSGGAWRLGLLHDRDVDLLFWITKGQGVATIDGIRRGVGVHNAIYIPSGRLFSLELGRQGFGQALLLPRDADLGFPEEPYHLRLRDVMAQGELSALLEAMGREQSTAEAFAAEAAAAYARLVAIWLRRRLAQNGSEGGETAASRLVRSYALRLVSHPAGPAGTSAHAAALGVSHTHLSRVCKSLSGRTAAAMFNERLLHQSRAYLQDTTVPVKDIARHLGFGTAAYFTRYIRKHTGKSPTALREPNAAKHPKR